MGRFYTPDQVKFIIILTVVMVLTVVIATVMSILCSRKRRKEIDIDELTGTEYTLTTDFTDVWSVQGHYNPLAV